MIKKIRVTVSVAILLLAMVTLMPPVPVAAETDSETTNPVEERRQQREQDRLDREAMTATRLEKKEERCQEAQTKTAEQIKKFDGMKSEQDARYARFVKKLELAITKLNAEAVDTTKLQQDKEKLVALIAELSAALGDYADAVAVAQQLAPNCGSAQGEFKAALQATRTQMQIVRTKAQAIRTFMNGTLKEDLQAARRGLRTSKPIVSPKPTTSPSPTPATTPSPTGTPKPL